MKNIFKEEKFSIRKFTVGAASVMIGASLLVTAPLQSPVAKAAENMKMASLKAESSNEDVSLKIVEKEGGAVLEITATKDISNVDVKVTLDGNKVTTYHIDSLKKGEKIQKELSAEQLGLVKKQLQQGKKTLPNTAVVRKSLEGSLNLDGHVLKVEATYDVEVMEENPTPTPIPGDNGNTNVQPGDNGNTTPEQPGDNGNTNPQPGDNGNTNVQPGDNGNTNPQPGDNGNTNVQPGDNGNTNPMPGDNQPTEDKELKDLKAKANEKVKYSEKIADKKPYYDRITAAKTKAEVENVIKEVDALNNNVTPPTPTVDKTLAEVKAELTKLVAENLKAGENYKKLPNELQTAYNKAFARAQYLLANSTSKEDIAKQVKALEKAATDVKNYKEENPAPGDNGNTTPQPGDNGNTTPQPGDNGNTTPQPGDNGNTNPTIPADNGKELEGLKAELKKLVDRNIRDEKGYVPNNGNQTDNNNWITAKINAEAVLKNNNASKEDIEKAINDLSEKTYIALLGSEKTKVRTALENSSLEMAEKGPLKASINKAKTFKELDEIAKKVGSEVKVPTLPPKYKNEQGNSGNVEPTPQPGDNGNTNPTPGDNGNTNVQPGDNGNTNPTPGDNGNTNPTPGDNGNTNVQPGDNGNTNPQPGDNGNTNVQPGDSGNTTPGDNTTTVEVTAVKESIKRGNIEGKGGSLLLDVVGKNLDPKKVTINAYVNGKKAENVIFENFPGATKELVSFNVKVPENKTNSAVTYKFVAVVDGKESDKSYEKVQDTFVETAKITNYENKNTILPSEGGVASLLLKGSNLNDKNVKVRIFDADEVKENAELTKKVVYTKQGNDILVSVELPKNTTASSKSYKLKLYANEKEVNITTLDGRDRRDKPVFTVVGVGQEANKPVLSNATITSYKTSGTGAVSDGVEKTETTVASNQVSKKTEVHLYGANLDAKKTRVRITDQNGVEWPIGGAESDLIKMVLENKGGMKGILGNGTFQIAEIILPSNLSEDMTFTYTFAVDGVNFDTAHQVRAHVEKTGGQVNPTAHKVTLKYQTADGKEIAKDKVVDVYSHFPVSSGVTAIDGYTFEKVKDLAADSNFGDKNEVVYIYKEKSTTPQPGNNGTVTPTPGENEKPTPGTGNNSEKEELTKLKADLKVLADRDLTKEANYKMAGEPQESAWKTNVKKANELLANPNATKEELANRIDRLTKAIKALEDGNKEKNKEETPAPQPTPSPEVTSLDNLVIKSLTKDGKALGDVPFRLHEYDGAIPNIIAQPKTDKEGNLTIQTTSLKKDHEYELRVEKRDSSFVRQSLRFTTDENGKINTIDGKEVNKDTSNTIEFRVEKDNDQEVKKVTSYFKVVDEKGNPVEGVELSASGIANKITTLKNAKSNKDGIVALELESKVNGENYVINVSKNDQFNWDFLPDAVSIFVENGELNYTDKEGKYKTFNYNDVEIPVFVVTKHDQNHLKKDLVAKIKEAEEVLKTNNNKELSDIVASAKAELAKPETLPIYVKGYLDNLNNQLSKMKEAETPVTKKVEVGDMIVSKDGRAVTEDVTFEFVPKTGEAETFTAPNGILSGVELTAGEAYTLRVKENAKYSYEKEVEVKEIPDFDMYGLFEKGSEEPLVELKLAAKETKPVEPVEEEDDPAYRKTLDVRVLRDGQPVANEEFGVLKFAEDNSSREIKTVKTDEKGMISIKVLEELPKDGVFTLYSKENSKKFIAFYSDNEGWLWNVNGSEFNEKTPKVFELVLDSKKPAVDEKLEAKKKEARQVVSYSEKIHDKTPYMNRIKAATSVEVLDALIAEVNALNNNSSAERPGEDENTTSEVTTYKANKEVVDKGDGKIEVTFEGTNVDVNKLSYTVKKGVSKLGTGDYAIRVVSKEANKVIVEFTLSEAVRSNSDQYKILAKYNNETIRSAAVAFTMK